MTIENFNPTGYFSVAKFTAACYLFSVLPSIKAFVFLSERSLYFFWPVLTLFFWITLTSIFNINSFSSRVIDGVMLQNILVFVVIVNHARRDRLGLDLGLYAYAFGAFCVSLLLFLNIGVTEIEGALVDGELVYRTSFFNAGPNELGIKLVAGVFIIIGFYFQNPLSLNKKNRLILLCFIPIILLAILKTGSRTSVLLLLLSGLFWFLASILNSQNKFKIMLAGLIGISVLFIPLVVFVSQLNVAETLVARAVETGQGGDFSKNGRFVIWAGFLSLITDRPIFGYGLAGYDQATNNFFGSIFSPHNVLLEILIYGGIIGLLLYLTFLVRIFLACYEMLRMRGEILPVLLLPTVLAFVVALQGLRDKTCWLILAYIVGSFVFSQNRKKTMLSRDFK